MAYMFTLSSMWAKLERELLVSWCFETDREREHSSTWILTSTLTGVTDSVSDTDTSILAGVTVADILDEVTRTPSVVWRKRQSLWMTALFLQQMTRAHIHLGIILYNVGVHQPSQIWGMHCSSSLYQLFSKTFPQLYQFTGWNCTLPLYFV